MTLTDADYANDDASPNAINTAPHAPNAATTPDSATITSENQTYVRQLIDDQEYPVAEIDIIKKGFDSKAAVERCVDYLHGLYKLMVCYKYTCDRITSCT